MLARLGLRAKEVATLTLDDVDWRTGQFLIRGKGRRRAFMPPYPFAAVTTVADAMILACQDHRTAAVLVWFSCWLPRMVQVADPPAPPTRLDR